MYLKYHVYSILGLQMLLGAGVTTSAIHGTKMLTPCWERPSSKDWIIQSYVKNTMRVKVLI